MHQFKQLPDKRIVMTGGAANIGRACAVMMAEHGARIVIGDIDEAGAQRTAEMIKAEGGTAYAVATDVTSAESMQQLLDSALDLLGGVDVGFFNAGIQRSGPVTQFTTADWDAVYATNVRHCFLGAKVITPHLLKAGGAVIFTASAAGIRGAAGLSAYASSKSAVIGLGKSLAAELAPRIRVNILCPGWVDTPFNQPIIDLMGGRETQLGQVRNNVPLGREGTPGEIAGGAVFLASDAASFMTGQLLVIDGGAS